MSLYFASADEKIVNPLYKQDRRHRLHHAITARKHRDDGF
jgi:hypothetical protein